MVAEPEPSEPGDAAVERLVAVAVAAVAGDPLPDPLTDDRVVRRVRTVVDAIRAADPAPGR